MNKFVEKLAEELWAHIDTGKTMLWSNLHEEKRELYRKVVINLIKEVGEDHWIEK